MYKNRFTHALGLLVVASIVLTACAPAAPAEPAEPVVVTQEVVVTQQVEVEREPFTTPHPILSDLKVREALSYCTNKADLIKSVYVTLTPEQQEKLIMHTNIPRDHWAYAGDDNITIYPFDPDKGKALLDEAGWTLQEGNDFRTNANGESLSLQFTTTNATFRQTWAAVWEQQMADCGVQIVRLHAPASWWFGDTTGLARRDYELGAFAWVGEADPGGQTLYACDQIPLPSNGWEGQNGMGWCNETASAAIKQANNTLVKDERIAAYTTFQAEFTKDIPSIPLFNRTDTLAANAKVTGLAPTPGQPYYTYNVADWELPGSDTIVMGFPQEPASLFVLVEDAFVASLAISLTHPNLYTSLNYDFQPVLIKDLPTIENGGTTNNDVEVKEGDKVVDANGDVVDLAAGVTVKNAAGEDVEFTGGTVTMKQLVSKFEFIDGLTWEDGTPVSAADIELSKKIACDPESGATSFITCEKTASTEFFDLGFTQTWLPGVQDPLYFVPNFWGSFELNPLYPAHQVLSDGRTLADVPASEWATLPEVAEHPLSYGPYKLDSWTKGESLVFSTNEHWAGTPPKTPNLVIQIITPESQEALLLGGEIDLLGSEAVVSPTETLAAAETEGKIKLYVSPSATWEHIDIQLFLR
jgi:ABC-type transport system substrate-binding protein